MYWRYIWVHLILTVVLTFSVLELQLLNLRTTEIQTSKNLIKDFSRNAKQSKPHANVEGESTIVIYNKVPKTGSTTFTRLVRDLSAENSFYVVGVNTTKNRAFMPVHDQYHVIQDVTAWRKLRPLFFHGHIAYLDFKRFGSPIIPIYINIVRNPLDRLVSYYYFVRYGDDYRVGLRRSRQGDKTTFDECVKKGVENSDCSVENIWKQIPFFCGQAAQCWEVGNEWALEEAKRNLVNNYMLVGLTENMADFILVLEAVLPRMFRGISDMYKKGSTSHTRKTIHKEPPNNETLKIFQDSKIWKMEMEFYNFAKAQFEFIKEISTVVINGKLEPAPKAFRYGKMFGPQGKIEGENINLLIS